MATRLSSQLTAQLTAALFIAGSFIPAAFCQTAATAPQFIVLHAAHMLDVKAGRLVSPAEISVEGDRITEVGTSVKHPSGAQVIDLGDQTLMPGLIDAH